MTLRTSALSNRWPQVPLGEAVEFLDHRRKPITASERVPGPYPYYGANGQQDSVAEYLFDEPLILLAEDGGHFDDPSRGIAYGVTGKCWVNNHAHVLRPRSTFDFRFLCWHLSHYDISGFINGTTRAKLTKSAAEQIPVILPPLAEQRRIADILDKADAIRRKRKEAIALTEELLRSAFLDMFGDPVTNPKGWPVKALGELADAASGVTKGKRYDGQTMVTLPYMRVANVQDGHLVLDEIKTITVSEEDGRRYQLRVGDVLLTEGGDPDKLGRGTVWRGEIANCIHQNHIFRVRPSSDVRSEYLSATIGSERGKRYFLQAAKQTTGIATINMTQLKAFPVLLPPIALQAEYSAFIERAAAARGTFQRRGDMVDDLFNSLVARAFSGALESPR